MCSSCTTKSVRARVWRIVYRLHTLWRDIETPSTPWGKPLLTSVTESMCRSCGTFSFPIRIWRSVLNLVHHLFDIPIHLTRWIFHFDPFFPHFSANKRVFLVMEFTESFVGWKVWLRLHYPWLSSVAAPAQLLIYWDCRWLRKAKWKAWCRNNVGLDGSLPESVLVELHFCLFGGQTRSFDAEWFRSHRDGCKRSL